MGLANTETVGKAPIEEAGTRSQSGRKLANYKTCSLEYPYKSVLVRALVVS